GLDGEVIRLGARDQARDDRKHAFAERREKTAFVGLRIERVAVEAERAARAEREQRVVAHRDPEIAVVAGDDTVALLKLHAGLRRDLLARALQVGTPLRRL